MHSEPKYECKDCGEKFRWFRELTAHRHEYHELTCGVCDRIFTAKEFFMLHFQVHMICKPCNLTFTTPEEAAIHHLEVEHEPPK